MKRRKILKMLGVSALSLTGIERLAKAMAFQNLSPARVEVCIEEAAVVCAVSASTSEGYSIVPKCLPNQADFVCGDNEGYYRCNNFECGNWKNQSFICEPQVGDFNCVASFTGCNDPGDFTCLGRDPHDAQFNCSNDFKGCNGEGVFTCEDFICKVHYRCGRGNTCPSYPFDCSGTYTA